jgi:type I restriction enzyme S subunit
VSFPRYPAYKASGMEWLNEVPTHWGVGSLRWLTRRYSGGTPDKTNLSYWEDGTIPWLNSGSVNDRVIKEPSTYITADAFSSSSAKWIPEGALVMALAGQGKTKGMVARLAIRTTCNQSMAAIIPGTEVSSSFLFWWLDSNYQNIRNMAGGDLRDGLNLELLGNIQCPIPTLVEQDRIAAFLDRETTKLDALAAEQRRLIDLLKEKRQALISHAVTKGLNPHARMKPSGFIWLGDVPDHWDVTVIKRFSTLQRGHDLTDVERTEGVYPVVTSGGISGTHGSFMARGPGVVTGRYGSTGRLFYIETDFWPHNTSLYVSDFHDNAPRFVWYSLHTVDFTAHSAKAAVPGIDRNDIHVLPVAVPPKDEQLAIVAFLDSETARLDQLTAEAQRVIDLLRERRTALISASVTGKIDVRGLVKTEAA